MTLPMPWCGDYDPAGNRLTRTTDPDGSPPAVTTTYAYDDLNQMKSASVGGVTTDYAYDANGNRVEKYVQGGSSGIITYVYDMSDRLVSVANEQDGPLFAAAYDARTRRIAKTEYTRVGSTSTPATKLFRYDGGTNFQELEDADGQGSGTAYAIFTELVRAGGMGGGIGSVLYTDQGMAPLPLAGPVEHFVYNAIGHTVATTDAQGAVRQSNVYEAFGETVAHDGDSTNNRLRNTKERDTSIGLDNDGFRYYDPEVGRYVQRDPIGYGDGLNVYASVGNNPINHVDPLGLANASSRYQVGERAFVRQMEGTDAYQIGYEVERRTSWGSRSGTRSRTERTGHVIWSQGVAGDDLNPEAFGKAKALTQETVGGWNDLDDAHGRVAGLEFARDLVPFAKAADLAQQGDVKGALKAAAVDGLLAASGAVLAKGAKAVTATRAGNGAISSQARTASKLGSWWRQGADQDEYWKALSTSDKYYYEIGQKTMESAKFARYANLDPVTRGRAIATEVGHVRALLPESGGWRLGTGMTLSTGPTPAVRYIAPRAGVAIAGGTFVGAANMKFAPHVESKEDK